MSFWGTLFCALIALFFCRCIGWRIARLAQRRLQHALGLWMSPVIGFALSLFVLVPWGWFGPGFSHPLFRSLVTIAFGVGAVASFRDRLFWHGFALNALVLIIGTFPFAVQILRFDAFDAFNDPWTYSIQSQWLQTHGLADSVPLRNDTAALTQVYFTQSTGTRAAAQFGVAAIQSMYGLEWAHEAYPVAVLLYYCLGLLVVAYAVMLVRSRRRVAIAFLASVCVGVTLNGFSFGALRGYLPQTIGLACGAAGLILAGVVVDRVRGHQRMFFGTQVIAAILLSGCVYTYSEFLPFVIVGLGAIGLSAILLWKTAQARLVSLAIIVTGWTLLCAPEFPRAIKAIVGQSKAVVGEGIPWSAASFLAHCLGVQAGFPDGDFYLVESRKVAAIVLATMCVIVLVAFYKGRRLVPRGVLVPFTGIAVVSVLLFAQFRYLTASPFAIGTGQSWSQFKLAGWNSLFVLTLIFCGLAAWRTVRVWVLCCGWLLVAVCLYQSWGRADARTAKVRATLGRDDRPFSVLTEVRTQLDSVGAGGVYLDFGPDDPKSRQFLAYALLGRPVLSDWSQDVFVSWMLPSYARLPKVANGALQVRRARVAERGREPAGQIGAYVLERRTRNLLNLQTLRGDYGLEQTPEGPVNWIKDFAIYRARLPASREALTLLLRAEVISAVPGLSFRLRVRAGDSEVTKVYDLPESHNAWQHPPAFAFRLELPAGSDVMDLEFRTDAEPRQLGTGDARQLTFLLRNLEVEVLP